MKRLYILCEGQTEYDFISMILSPYLQSIDVIVIPIICTTKITPTKKYKGGVTNFTKIKKELQRLCGEHRNEMVTTMFDLYAFPYDALDLQDIPTDVYAKVKHIERAISGFSKVTDGIDVAEIIGIEKITAECLHFANWLAKLTTWATCPPGRREEGAQ